MRGVLFWSVTVVICLAALLAVRNVEGATTRYGAVAFSEDDGEWGFIVKMPSQEMADKQAVEICKNKGGTSCAVKGDFTHYGALAMGDGVYGIGGGDTKALAEKTAMEACSEKGSGCKIVKSDSNY